MFNGHKWWHKVARTGSYNDLSNVPTPINIESQITYNNFEKYEKFCASKYGNVISINVHGITKSTCVSGAIFMTIPYHPLKKVDVILHDASNGATVELELNTSGQLVSLTDLSGQHWILGQFTFICE